MVVEKRKDVPEMSAGKQVPDKMDRVQLQDDDDSDKLDMAGSEVGKVVLYVPSLESRNAQEVPLGC